MKLIVTQQIITEAVNHAEQRMQYEFNRFGFNDEKRKNMIVIGTIGQLIFKQYLEANNIRFNFELQAGRYDMMDFMIHNDIIEIKTSGFKDRYESLNLLYSQDQYETALQKRFKYCIQLFVNGLDFNTRMVNLNECNECVFGGYISFESMSYFKNERKFYGDDYKVPIEFLEPIESLIGYYLYQQKIQKTLNSWL